MELLQRHNRLAEQVSALETHLVTEIDLKLKAAVTTLTNIIHQAVAPIHATLSVPNEEHATLSVANEEQESMDAQPVPQQQPESSPATPIIKKAKLVFPPSHTIQQTHTSQDTRTTPGP